MLVWSYQQPSSTCGPSGIDGLQLHSSLTFGHAVWGLIGVSHYLKGTRLGEAELHLGTLGQETQNGQFLDI